MMNWVRSFLKRLLVVPFESPREEAQILMALALTEVPKERWERAIDVLVREFSKEEKFAMVDWSQVKKSLMAMRENA